MQTSHIFKLPTIWHYSVQSCAVQSNYSVISDRVASPTAILDFGYVITSLANNFPADILFTRNINMYNQRTLFADFCRF